MKKHFRNSIAFFLAFIILVSTTGVVVAAHSCLSKHETQVSLFSHKGCCSGDKLKCHSATKKETGFSNECCKLIISYHKVDVSTTLVKSFPLPDFRLFTSSPLQFSVKPIVAIKTPENFPPLLITGVSFLHSIHLLRI